MPLLRRQPAPSPHRAITAAATRINIGDRRQVARLRASRQGAEWQAEAWDYFDAIGEIGQPVSLMGNLVGKVRLFVGVRPEPDQHPIPVGDTDSGVPPAIAARAEAELARLRGPFGGQAVILAETSINFDIAGECYLVGRMASGDRAEEWDLKSVDEVKVDTDGAVKVLWDDTGEWEPINEDAGDAIIRLWMRHPRRSWQARSPLKALLAECDALLLWSAAIRSEARSRLRHKIILVPEELDPGGPPDPTHDQGDGEGRSSVLLDDLIAHCSEPIGDPDSAAASVPMFVMGKKDYLDGFRDLDTSSTAVEHAEERVEKRVARIARGLNLPPEVVVGFRETTFANALQVDQDTFDDFIEPRVVLICDALTVGFLRPGIAADVPAEWADRLEVWFDASDLIGNPNERENALEAHSRDVLSDEGLRRALDIPDTEAPTPEELLARRGLNATTTELLTLMMLRFLKEDIALPEDLLEVRRQEQEAGGSASTAAAPPPLALTAAAQVSDRVGRRLVDIDRSLRQRLEVAADGLLTQALARAGARLRSKLRADPRAQTIERVPNARVAATLGRTIVAALDLSDEDLVAGAFAGLGPQFDAWTAQAQADALAVVEAAVGGLDESERAELERMQAEDRADAWTWLVAALGALLAARLFDPDPVAPEVGELDETLSVPPGLIREAVARAGGAEGLERSGTVLSIQGGTQPAGGVGTGQRLMRYLGGRVSGWEWDYGPAPRTRVFEPHLALDGTRFDDWNDPALAIPGGWPGPLAKVGDHPGCLCDAVPLTVEQVAEEAA